MRKKFELFCFKHRNKGIPNLMMYISLGSAVVYLFTLFTNNPLLYEWLCFDRALILQGQVWRLFSYIFLFDAGNIVLTLIGLLCYYSLGQAIENMWGTCRFNLFYFSGVVMIDIYCMIFPCYASVSHLNLSLFLAYATLFPDAQFLLLFIIPIKAWVLAVVDLAITLIEVITYSIPTFLFPYNLFPLIAIANYLLFFGKDVVNVFPLSWRANAKRLMRKKDKKQQAPKVVPFSRAGSYEASNASVKAPYNHRCTVCGRTDITNPELEFRYCSRCNGYHCYCEDHIRSHTHIE